MHHYTKFYGATLQDLVPFTLVTKVCLLLMTSGIKTQKQQLHAHTHARTNTHTQRGTFMKLKTLNMRFDYEINLR